MGTNLRRGEGRAAAGRNPSCGVPLGTSQCSPDCGPRRPGAGRRGLLGSGAAPAARGGRPPGGRPRGGRGRRSPYKYVGHKPHKDSREPRKGLLRTPQPTPGSQPGLSERLSDRLWPQGCLPGAPERTPGSPAKDKAGEKTGCPPGCFHLENQSPKRPHQQSTRPSYLGKGGATGSPGERGGPCGAGRAAAGRAAAGRAGVDAGVTAVAGESSGRRLGEAAGTVPRMGRGREKREACCDWMILSYERHRVEKRHML